MQSYHKKLFRLQNSLAEFRCFLRSLKVLFSYCVEKRMIDGFFHCDPCVCIQIQKPI